MTFDPKPGLVINLNGESIKFIPLESKKAASVFTYAEAGKEGIVYKVIKNREYYALKVFYPDYQDEQLIISTKILNQYKNLEGLQVAERIVIDRKLCPKVLDKFPELYCSILMPWIYGTVWGNLMMNDHPLQHKQYYKIAQQLIKSVYVLESQGLAHCDLSNNNFIINSAFSSIQLIDIENLYAPDMQRPIPDISYGTRGYRTRWIAENGLWGPNSDRFAGAILCSEIITWDNKEIRDNRAGENSFFDEGEMGENCERYRIMKSCLGNLNNDLPALFEKAWFSENPNECPAIKDWLKIIDGNINLAVADNNSFYNEDSLKNKVDSIKENAAMKNNENAFSVKKGLPNEKSSFKAKIYFFIYFSFSGLLLAFAIILLGGVVKLVDPSRSILHTNINTINILVDVVLTIIYTTLISFVVGIIQLIIFNRRFKAGMFVYLLFSIISGIVGGIISSLLLYIFGWFDSSIPLSFSSIIMTSLIWLIIGLFVGVISGGVIGSASSILQNFLMKETKYRLKWFLYNLISWSIVYGAGLGISLGLNNLIEFPFMNDAIATLFILVAHGVCIVLFLNYSPQIEFS